MALSLNTLGLSDLISEGTTGGQVELARSPDTGVFVMSMVGSSTNPENRWTLEFSVALHKAFDAVEDVLSKDPPGTPAALLTVSGSDKFFSNGIDPQWAMNPSTPKEDKNNWADLVMPAFARPILLPCPTICAINGHAFGAGLMFALGHDHRLQRLERGFLCAIEVEIGVPTPPPEFTLFRHAVPADAYYSTVLEAKRWGAIEAAARGVVQKAVPGSELGRVAMEEAAKQAKLTKAGAVGWTKWHSKGFVAREILEYTFPGGKQAGTAKLPPGLAKHVKSIVVDCKMPQSHMPLARL
eukprot:TRINITY_DN95193_c0_g1_i1.p1 TRINITY_DN95193_c0_g1~~TRINITY_DN95193_c0_g1_i1.p1  ORF type:complete len:318 (-),score=63.33 TRINITY_DN95193_c0_g1_i1:152-1042(-)